MEERERGDHGRTRERVVASENEGAKRSRAVVNPPHRKASLGSAGGHRPRCRRSPTPAQGSRRCPSSCSAACRRCGKEARQHTCGDGGGGGGCGVGGGSSVCVRGSRCRANCRSDHVLRFKVDGPFGAGTKQKTEKMGASEKRKYPGPRTYVRMLTNRDKTLQKCASVWCRPRSSTRSSRGTASRADPWRAAC